MMTSYDWAYLAGFIDGEGCFTVHRNQGGQVYPRLIVSNTDPVYLKTLQEELGGKLHVQSHNPPRKANYRWVVNGRDLIVEIYPQLMPYLRQKKREAKLSLKMLDMPHDQRELAARKLSNMKKEVIS